MNKSFISFITTLLVFCLCTISCEKYNSESISYYLSSISISSHETNKLRVYADIAFKKDCDYSISFWKKDDLSSIQTTKSRHTNKEKERVTLMYMYADTEYEMKVNIEGTSISSKPLTFKTGKLPADVTEYEIISGQSVKIPGYIMQTALRSDGYMTIADTDGNVLWYQHSQPEGRDFTAVFDVLEPNLDENKIWYLNGYLFSLQSGAQAMGTTMGCVDYEGNLSYFWASADGSSPTPIAHHEIHELKDGSILVVSTSQKIYDLTSIGGEPNTTVNGDGYIIFNKQGQILKKWDIFEEIDPVTCPYTNAKMFYWDLVHGNSLGIDSEGYYYMSFNRINQVWKIDPQSGKVIYRVGENGNVTMNPIGYPSGVHAANPIAPNRILCLDNGIESQQSRGLIYKVNPATMSCEMETIVTLPTEYSSFDRSNVELIDNESTLMFGMTNAKVVVFTDLKGNIIKNLRTSISSFRTNHLDRLPVL